MFGGKEIFSKMLWISSTALCGLSLNNKDKSGALMNWDTPLLGLSEAGPEWYTPLMKHWGKIKSEKVDLRALSPHVDSERNVDLGRIANNGVVQAQLSKIEEFLGFPKSSELHSFRNWAPTVANQLRFPREERERLGHWAPRSITPDRYGKAVCATELRLRNEILTKVRSGWRPQDAFELENPKSDAVSDVDSDTSETSTCPEVHGSRVVDISDLYREVPKFEDFV